MNAFDIFFVSSLRTKYLNTTVLTLHLKVFRVSDYCSLRHFLYIGTRLIRTPRGMPYWDTKGHAILGHHEDTPYWDPMGTRQIVYVEMTGAKSRGSGTYVRGSGNLYERATVLGSNTGGKAD